MTGTKDAKRERGWCFTDYQDTDVTLEEYVTRYEKYYYLVVGLETCPDTGRLHWQGCVEWKNARYFNGIKREFPKQHWGSRKAQGEIAYKAWDYCKKEGTFIECGKRPVGAGYRSDLDSMAGQLLNGATPHEILEDQGDKVIRVYGNVRRIHSELQAEERKKIERKFKLLIFWGVPGAGKSKKARTMFPGQYYIKDRTKWWDGYNDEPCIILDDFNPINISDYCFEEYLHLFDETPFKYQIKGGFGYLPSNTTFILTSNIDPNLWFLDKPNRDAFFRRVNSIEYFGTPWGAELGGTGTGTEVGKGNTRDLPTCDQGGLTPPSVGNIPTFSGLI